MQENTQHYIEVKNISKKYESGNNIVNAVNDVSFYVDKGEFIGVMGSSGSGKTTILNLMSTIDTLSQGHILYDKVDIVNMKEDELSEFRKKNLGFVFQDYNLIPVLSVMENIMFPLWLDKRETDERFLAAVLRFLGISNKAHSLPGQLSGGQKQRVAIARALVAKPDILLADEPTGNLDSANSAEVVQLLSAGCRKLGQTIVMITHDEKIAAFADEVIRIEDGKILKGGK